ncbi:SOLUTE CARRIER PROTEIN FAMILY 11 MEMBER [Salix koriyanagi]|uniref:SOLUTE CARRIER PROTEIN FAMILY 11 MEMBER n=1 Tax=Salix koriyanagi TaxID=2511006 RepID=A0A9Q0X310_9ROSI|nr:SOLUTE CARRIER PROTEIN FAMILY 11 MEMBER [Salix koriyanagi]
MSCDNLAPVVACLIPSSTKLQGSILEETQKFELLWEDTSLSSKIDIHWEAPLFLDSVIKYHTVGCTSVLFEILISNMDTKFANANHPLHFLHWLLPAAGPGLLIAIGYVDPGKWAATVEGGARFGSDLICNDEYGKWTCMFLGVQAALSVIALDLTMILGIAHGLNLLFGMDLSTCVFLAAVDAILFPVFATLMERCKASLLCTCIAGFILLLYFFGVLISQPETPLSINGMQTKLSEESVFALMSLLGASIMPHNFFLHSSIVLVSENV